MEEAKIYIACKYKHIYYAPDFIRLIKLLENLKKIGEKDIKALKIVCLPWWCYEYFYYLCIFFIFFFTMTIYCFSDFKVNSNKNKDYVYSLEDQLLICLGF